MKKNNLLFGILAIMLVFAMTVVGCGDDSTDDNGDNTGGTGSGSSSVPETDVQVYNKDGTPYTGNGTVNYRVFNNGSTAKYIPVGAITNGKLTLSLPSSSDMDQLLGGTSTDFIYDGLVLGSGTTYISLYYAGETGNMSFSVGHRYSQRTLVSTGKYDYDIKPGWVKILQKYDTTQGTATYTSKINGLPSNMKWTLSR